MKKRGKEIGGRRNDEKCHMRCGGEEFSVQEGLQFILKRSRKNAWRKVNKKH